MRKFFRVILFLPFPALTAGAQEISPEEWQKIAPLKKIFPFPDMSNPSVDPVIPGVDGAPLHKLECRSGDTYEGREFESSGDFECRLNSASGKDASSTLLTYDPLQTRDFESRGRFFLSDLEGKCGAYPEWGAQRRFRLRGMQIVVEMSEVVLAPAGKMPDRQAGAIKRAKMHVRVKPDSAAISPAAMPSRVLDWDSVAGPGTCT